MAKVKFSALISEMRNKLNGSVFSKNRAGNYLRNKVTPVNPQTTYQTAVRSQLTAAAQNWRNLTEAQRLSWNGAVQNYQGTDIFGDVKTPSGINLYNKLYINALRVAGAPLTLPPAPGVTPSIPDVDVATDSAPQTFDVTSSLANIPLSESWIVRATAGLSPGKSYVKNELRDVAVLPAGAILPASLISEYTAKFGAINAGEKIAWEIIPVSDVTFIHGPSYRGTEINP